MSREYDSTYEGQLQKCGDERSALERTVDDLSEENQQLRADLAQRTADLAMANAKLAELSAVCEAAQFLVIRRDKTLDATIKELQTANERIETLESEVNKQEAEIRDLYYQLRKMEP